MRDYYIHLHTLEIVKMKIYYLVFDYNIFLNNGKIKILFNQLIILAL